MHRYAKKGAEIEDMDGIRSPNTFVDGRKCHGFFIFLYRMHKGALGQ